MAVVGLNITSEHEDDCCATIELKTQAGEALKARLASSFLQDVKASTVSKAARPDKLMFGNIPKNFKGAILVKDMKVDWQAHINQEAPTKPA